MFGPGHGDMHIRIVSLVCFQQDIFFIIKNVGKVLGHLDLLCSVLCITHPRRWSSASTLQQIPFEQLDFFLLFQHCGHIILCCMNKSHCLGWFEACIPLF